MTLPNIKEFLKFHNLLIKNRPDYTPFYFPLTIGGKDPILGVSWKKNRKTVAEAIDLMKQGHNIGIAGTDKDDLLIIDVDDEDAIPDVKPSLSVRSRKRTGKHYFYFVTEKELKQNIPTENSGEIRSNWQYCVACGSFVETNVEKLEKPIPEDQLQYAGQYTIEDEAAVSSIEYKEFPKIFREQKEKTDEQTLKLQEKKADVNVPELDVPEGEVSALYKLNIHDIFSIPNKKRFSSLYHGSETGVNTSCSNGLLHCWRHNCSHTPITALAVMSGMATCVDAGYGHVTSGGGTSCIDLKNGKIIYELWNFAKEQGFIPKDDKIPFRARQYRTFEEIAIEEKHNADAILKTSKAAPVDEKKIASGTPSVENANDAEEPENEKKDETEIRLGELNLPEDHIIKKYMKWQSTRNDAYPEFHFAAILGILSNYADRRVCIEFDQGVVYANMYIMVIGVSSQSRKTTALKTAKHIIQSNIIGDPNKLLPTNVSQEGMFKQLSETPRGTMLIDEGGSFFSKIRNKKYSSDLMYFLCELYENEGQKKRLSDSGNKKIEYEIKNPYLNIIMGIQPIALGQYTTKEDIASGHILRFFLVRPKYRDKKWFRKTAKTRASHDTGEGIYEELNRIRNFIGVSSSDDSYMSTLKNVKFRLSEQGEEYHGYKENALNVWSEKMAKENEFIQSATSRLTSHVEKLAMLFTAADIDYMEHEGLAQGVDDHYLGFTHVIKDEYLREAWRVVLTFSLPCFEDVCNIVTKDLVANLQEKILYWMDESRDVWVHQSHLLKKTRAKVEDLNKAIFALITSEELLVRERKNKHGLPTHHYKLEKASGVSRDKLHSDSREFYDKKRKKRADKELIEKEEKMGKNNEIHHVNVVNSEEKKVNSKTEEKNAKKCERKVLSSEKKCLKHDGNGTYDTKSPIKNGEKKKKGYKDHERVGGIQNQYLLTFTHSYTHKKEIVVLLKNSEIKKVKVISNKNINNLYIEYKNKTPLLPPSIPFSTPLEFQGKPSHTFTLLSHPCDSIKSEKTSLNDTFSLTLPPKNTPEKTSQNDIISEENAPENNRDNNEYVYKFDTRKVDDMIFQSTALLKQNSSGAKESDVVREVVSSAKVSKEDVLARIQHLQTQGKLVSHVPDHIDVVAPDVEYGF